MAHSSKHNFKLGLAHQTATNTHLPKLHNMSTASLLSNCPYDKTKQNSMMSNRSNYMIEKNSSSKKFLDEAFSDHKLNAHLTDEEKLKRFHVKWEDHKQQM